MREKDVEICCGCARMRTALIFSRIIHIEVQRNVNPPRVAVAAKDIRLGGDALGCIRAGVGEEGDGRSVEVLEAHAQVGNVGPRIADCAELPVENCERAAGRYKLLQFGLEGREGRVGLPVCGRSTAAGAAPHNVVDAKVTMDNAHGTVADTSGCFAPGNEEIAQFVHLRDG
jgi:hypothetical protein